MDVRSFEKTIRRIPGVEAARVVMNGAEPAEIHILAQPGKPAKQLVRDVESVALAAYGMKIDRRIVSIVQIENADLITGDRPVVEDVAEQIDGSRTTVTVTLSWHEERLVGRATGPAATSTRLRLVAEATIAALEQALDEQAAFAVQAVATPMVGTHEVAVVQVVIVVGDKERMLVGSALVNGDPSRATVRAVLDALNRIVPSLRRSP
jgi:hypothetical protein